MQCSFLHLAVLAGEFLRQHGEVALGAFLVARRGAQLERPVRPGQQLVLVQRRLRHDLEIRHRHRALTDRRADAVRAGVAAADDDDVLAVGEDRRGLVRRLAADAAVLLRQEFHREMNAVEFAAGDRQVARLFGAAGQHHRVVILDDVFDRRVDADMRVVMERHAFRLHLRDAAVDVNLFHLEVGNAVAQQAAGLGEFLVDMHVVAGARELLRGGKSRRP